MRTVSREKIIKYAKSKLNIDITVISHDNMDGEFIMIVNGLKYHNNNSNSAHKSENEYPCHHDKGVDNEIYTYLIRRYEEKGRNFFFRASQLPFPYLSSQRKGAALRRLCQNTKNVERWNTGRIMVWKTRFDNGNYKSLV